MIHRQTQIVLDCVRTAPCGQALALRMPSKRDTHLPHPVLVQMSTFIEFTNAGPVLFALASALLVMLAPLSGKLLTHRLLGTWISRHLPYLISFAGGVFLVVAWHLSEETLHEGSLAILPGGALAGAAFIFVLTRFFSSEHHHHGHHHGHSHSKTDGRRVLVSDAFHNIGDGIVLALAFTASTIAGIGVAIAIFLHEAMQEMSEFFVLKEAGYFDREALLRNFAVSSTILFGVFLGLTSSSIEASISLPSAFAVGGIACVILANLLPNALQCIKEHGKEQVHVTAMILRIALMLSVRALTPHEEHVDDVHEGELALVETH